MTTIRIATFQLSIPALAALSILLAGCETSRFVDHAESGQRTTCVITTSERLMCAGESIGDGSPSAVHLQSAPPKLLDKGVRAVSLSDQSNAGCVIHKEVTVEVRVWCWSSDFLPFPVPVQLPTVPNPTHILYANSISVGSSVVGQESQDACAVVPKSGNVLCWQFTRTANVSNYRLVSDAGGETLKGAAQVSVGFGFGCAVKLTGSVWCWGINDAGQLGRGQTGSDQSYQPVGLVAGVQARSVSVGFNHACALTFSDTIVCWGSDEYGQLGNGQSDLNTIFPFATPQTVVGYTGATTLSAGHMFTCAARSDSTVSCWGSNADGKLARSEETLSHSSTPLQIPLQGGSSGLRYVVVSAGRNHACASMGVSGFNQTTLTASGAGLMIQCWGGNTAGQLLDGTTNPSFVPVTATH